MSRDALRLAKRIVVKVGSSSLTSAEGGLDAGRLDALVDALGATQGADPAAPVRELILVSSGAIAAGLAPLGMRRRPRDLATLQAAASVGQMLLVAGYADSFARYDRCVGQVLLTAEDIVRRAHYRNARRTLERLLALRVVPIVNENDALATAEIRFGDNDRLAALVAHLVGADALVLLSDVDGVYESDPRKAEPGRPVARLDEVRGEEDLAGVLTTKGSGSAGVGSGGMSTKIDAARVATAGGCAVVVGAAGDAAAILAGEPKGTFFHPAAGRRTSARLLWLAHASAPRGRLYLDAGAVRAVVQRRMSLLSAGLTAVEGEFAAGDPVDLSDPAGHVVARGIVAYDAAELPAMLGRSTVQMGPRYSREVVHRDDLVLMPDSSRAVGRRGSQEAVGAER
ncbi:MAG TPA: glutamate 5-kinase [Frankiaceae bacterium]|nr:glutamate 5-kinase [Frankiaceae bacterium]